MDIDERLKSLKNIQSVETPLFLLSRIMQSISLVEKQVAPLPLRWAFAAAAVVVIALNISVLFTQLNVKKSTGVSTIVSAMQMTNTNDIYHE